MSRFKITLAALFAASLLSPAIASAQEKKIEEELHIHRYKMQGTAPYDAFVYNNRVPDKPGAEETPQVFAGRILGNIANVEGRILVKVPPGWERPAYDGFKLFMATGAEGGKAGNCVACHVPPTFGDAKDHQTPGGNSVMTPSLRNLSTSAPYFADDSAKSLEDAVRAKMQIATDTKKAGEATDVEYQKINITEEDIANLVAFLKQLDEVEKDQFRPLILDSTILDTAYLWEDE